MRRMGSSDVLDVAEVHSGYPVAGGLCCSDGLVQAVGFADHYRIEISYFDLECPSQVDHVLVRDPHETGLDLRNTASGPLAHSEDL
jgi:hypothetical protein